MSCDLDLHFPSDEVGHWPCAHLICTSGKTHFFVAFPPHLEAALGLNPGPVSRPPVPTLSVVCVDKWTALRPPKYSLLIFLDFSVVFSYFGPVYAFLLPFFINIWSFSCLSVINKCI